MAKHTQEIRPQQPTNCLSAFNHFWELALKGLNIHWSVHTSGYILAH